MSIEASLVGGSDRRRIPEWAWALLPYVPGLLAVPALALGIALFARGPSRARRRLGGAIAAGAGAGLVRWQLSRLFSEEPRYLVERELGRGLELRRYAPKIVAETVVAGDRWDEALGEGFRRLAGYIFGANERAQEIAMTAPVTARRGEEIAMTSPVTARAGDGETTVAFVMPPGRPLESLPRPGDPRVGLREVPEERVAVLRSHGRYRGARVAALQAELLRRVRAAGLIPLGAPMFAGYDAPSTLPRLRRVEAWVLVA